MINSPFYIQHRSDNILDIKKLYSSHQICFFPYARYAFLELLENLGLNESHTIYLPAFICRDMLSPINKLGISMCFYHVNRKLEPEIDMSIKADVIMSVNYFGLPQNIIEIKKYCKAFGAIHVEDNAHGFLSRDEKNNLLGTRGDYGLLSIRKTVSLPNGAALLYRNSGSFKSSETLYTFEDDLYYKKLKVKKMLSLLPFNLGVKIGIIIIELKRFLRKVKTGYKNPLSDPNSELELPKNYNCCELLKDGIININVSEEIKRRIEIYNEIGALLRNYVEPIFSKLNDNCVPFEYPFILDKKNEVVVEKILKKKGFYMLPWPDLMGNSIVNDREYYKKIKVVPFLW